MKVLVAVASRHASTLGIGRSIVEALVADRLEAELQPVEAVTDLSAYGAVVLGSAVYAGHWLRSAREFADAHEAELRTLPVWLFSSGPIGDPPKPVEDAAEVAELAARLDAREHRSFAGKLDHAELGLGEKALVKLVRAPEGDFRPWLEVEAWAAAIATALAQPVTSPA